MREFKRFQTAEGGSAMFLAANWKEYEVIDEVTWIVRQLSCTSCTDY